MDQDKNTKGQSMEGTPSDIKKEEPPKSNPEMEPERAKAKKEDAEKILHLLEKCSEEAVVLTGKEGTGKTWLAKQITKSAVSDKGSFYMSLWLSLNQSHQDYDSLRHSIARQLAIPTTGSVWEDADDVDDEKYEEYAKNLEQLKQKVKEKLVANRDEMLKKKNEEKHSFLLLVLDSEGTVKTEDYDHIMKVLFPFEDFKNELRDSSSIKVLITRRPGGGFINKGSFREVEIQPLSGDEAVSCLEQRVGNGVSNHPGFKPFCDAMINRSKVLPAQVVMLAEALDHIAEDGSEAQERAFDAAVNILQQADKDDPIPLLHFTYEKLPGDCVIDCFWHSWKFLGKHGGVQYNELITHWILEGHLDLADGVKAAYEKGYQVMRELIDRGMLKMQEDNLIVLEGATRALDDHSCRGLFEISNLGLGSVLEGDNRKVFERMAPADGMMKTVSVDKKGESVSSLLIDGSRLCREAPETFFQAKQKVKILALFYPRLTSLPEPISKMQNLLVLVLRGGNLLNNIQFIKNLKALVVLEISGSPFLEEMPEELFEEMSQLRSLNLSALGIKSLPPSVSNLSELRRLILRKCSFLEALPKLKYLKKLEVIDLSGCFSLIKIQEKCFRSFENLQVIDFSEIKIEKLPIVQTLKNLTLLLVRGCDRLSGLRSMKHLPSLKVLDVSGATSIKEIYYDGFDDTNNLRILDLSKTEIWSLPDSLGKHLCDLRLQGCFKLEKIPSTIAFTDLESLDLSDCSGLENFPDGFFEQLTSLQSLNLSKTKVRSLPTLSKLHNLRRLFLKGCLFQNLPELTGQTRLVELDLSDCESLTNLPSLAHLVYLEIINLSGCRALSQIDQSFQKMSWLQVLNLSETQIPSFPSLCKPSKLRSLILKNCTKLQNSPKFEILLQLELLDLRGTSSLKDFKVESLNHLAQLQTLKLSKLALQGKPSLLLEALENLEVLDLSGEAVDSLPTLDGLSNLRQLLLRDCSSLKELPSLNSLSHLEVLDLSGTKVKNLPEKISNLTHLKRLHLPEGVIEEFEGNVNFLPLELKFDRCCISKPSDIPEGGEKPRIIVHGTELFESLKENSTLLESIRPFIISIHSQSQSKDEDNYGDSRKHIFRDIYCKIRKTPPEAKDGQSLEIHGFDHFPTGIEFVLEQTKYVIMVENNFLKNLSDLKPGNLKNIRGCWLERCNKMESIFMEEDLGNWEELEILWISNLLNLKSLYEEKVQSPRFRNLKHLHIDCCPTLETVFSTAQIPENLETFQITFCYRLKLVFGDEGSANGEVQTTGSENKKVEATGSADNQVQNMSSADRKVQTTSSADKEVPTTSSADKEVQAQTMSIANKEVQTSSSTDKEVQTRSFADKEAQAQAMTFSDKEVQAQTTSSADKEVQNTSFADKEAQAQATTSADKEVQTKSFSDKEAEAKAMTSADKEVQAQTKRSVDKGVQAQAMSSADKGVQAQTTSLADKEQTMIRTNLKHLHISYCPMLETVFSSALLPKNLAVLQIKCCDKLKSLFGHELDNSELRNLHTLHLLELPAWTGSSIGFKLNESVLKDVKVSSNIPVDKSLISRMHQKKSVELKRTEI